MEQRGLEDLIRAFSLDLNTELDLVGFGSDEYIRLLKALILPKDSTRIRVLPAIDDNTMYDVLTHYDIGVAFYPETGGLNNVYCAPNKVYQYIQAGLAILTTANPGLVELIELHQIGAYIRQLRQTDISAAIGRIRESRLYDNVTDEVRQLYCWESAAPTFLSAFPQR
jgi:glycosyltransferase involved in cell wall biosynthesis